MLRFSKRPRDDSFAIRAVKSASAILFYTCDKDPTILFFSADLFPLLLTLEFVVAKQSRYLRLEYPPEYFQPLHCRVVPPLVSAPRQFPLVK